MKIVIYTKDDCIWCSRAKNLLTLKNIPFSTLHMNIDISRDEILETFPLAKTMPIVVIDDVWIGGYIDLENYLEQKDL